MIDTDQVTPKISVMICVYNGAEDVLNAINSILNQTFTDFELIVVDDGSEDNTVVRIESCTDPRLRFFKQPHQGIPKTRNHALSKARGELFAVLDADDVAHPNRLQAQVDFLDIHENVILLGTSYLQVDHLKNSEKQVTPPQDDASIRRAMIRGNPFCHSTVMMRRYAVEKAGAYSEDFPFVQDYELWTRLAQQGQMANLPDALISRHYHPRSVSNNWRNEFYRFTLFARANHFAIQRLGASKISYIYTARTIIMFFVLDVYAIVKSKFNRYKSA